MQIRVSGMNALNNKMRSLIAFSLLASQFIFVDAALATVTTVVHKATMDSRLSKIGFLDFKTLLFSPASGENLDGVFDQIKFIGPEMFSKGSLKHDSLSPFKRSTSIHIPTNSAWGWEDLDKDLRDLGVVGKPVPASNGLVDAILSDIKDSIRNHGVSAPTIGSGTSSYLNAATQDVIQKISKLENSIPANLSASQMSPEAVPPSRFLHYATASLLGLCLIIIGFWRRRIRKPLQPPIRTIDPAACFEAIQNSPIQYSEKTV